MPFRLTPLLRSVAASTGARRASSQPALGAQEAQYWDALKKQRTVTTLFASGVAVASLMCLVAGYQFSILTVEIAAVRAESQLAVKTLEAEIAQLKALLEGKRKE
ncbi:hypothetical protein HDU86_002617 [Geranomyces michiganensis]|nr:hypothetical protein HDU86_002617 [Geranomyces michiganensis]